MYTNLKAQVLVPTLLDAIKCPHYTDCGTLGKRNIAPNYNCDPNPITTPINVVSHHIEIVTFKKSHFDAHISKCLHHSNKNTKQISTNIITGPSPPNIIGGYCNHR